jgi:DNA invertase Pin-like site-specific DNA recombinase
MRKSAPSSRTRVVLYCRVSTVGQAEDGVSLDAQFAKLRAYAGAVDLEIVGEETDAGLSAGTLERPGLTRALDMLRRREADAIAVTKLDRLTRSVKDLGALVETYFAVGKGALISLGETIDTRSAGGRLVLNVLGSVAQWEREAIAERTTVALQHKRAKGERVGSVPFGFRLDGDGVRLVPLEGEQQTIARAAELRAEGRTLRETAEVLAAEGRFARSGRAFAAQQIVRLVAAAVRADAA